MSEAVIDVRPQGFPWDTLDPFLFCVHHDDAYPAGNEAQGPAASLAGRDLGMDFAGRDGWRMYHGRVVPGFPQHPHRGFETVTIVRRGLVDHSDSLGATARFGGGDVQWLTAGRGISHSEMFPLVHRDAANPLELFQIWLNLPRADKLVDAHFAMLWGPDLPRRVDRDEAGRATEVVAVAGDLAGSTPPSPPPRSWASRPDTNVGIATLKLDPGARWTLPPTEAGTNRALYLFAGSGLTAAGRPIPVGHRVLVRPELPVELVNGPATSELLLLQGKPIGEPVVAHGPFVMTTTSEVQQAFLDYRRGAFGVWPWLDDAPVHPREAGRFARHADGRTERPAG